MPMSTTETAETQEYQRPEQDLIPTSQFFLDMGRIEAFLLMKDAPLEMHEALARVLAIGKQLAPVKRHVLVMPQKDEPLPHPSSDMPEQKPRKSRAWTPEQRAAQAERMRKISAQRWGDR